MGERCGNEQRETVDVGVLSSSTKRLDELD
jgi:hypothetical protein